MTGKVFMTESGRACRAAAAALAVYVIMLLACGIASIGSDVRALSAARAAFGTGIALSYAVPLFMLAYAFWNERYSCYRVAGVKDSDVCGGRILVIFVWTAAFLAAEILLSTLFDALVFIGRENVRNVLHQSWFMLSLSSHGAGRLLMSVSAAAAVSLVYYCYDAVKCAAKIPTSAKGKAAAAVAAVIAVAAYQLLAAYVWQGSAAADLNFLTFPDSVLPVPYGTYRGIADAVKDYHLLCAPVLNLLFLLTEGVFVLACVFFKKWAGRCSNEIEG